MRFLSEQKILTFEIIPIESLFIFLYKFKNSKQKEQYLYEIYFKDFYSLL